MKRVAVLALTVTVLLAYQPKAMAQVSPPKEFITSVTYGVLSGTLMGIASLAFTKNPGDNLNKIARGASLGLYLGIALGLYVAYGVGDEPAEDMVLDLYRAKKPDPSLIIYPLIEEKGIEGVAGLWRVTSF